jgi:hypothetical protein
MMLSETMERQRKLMSLICELKVFTKARLIEEYHSIYSNNNGFHNDASISEFLKDASRLGIVRKSNGCYKLAEQGENRYL